jgi:8-amino-7-oxononanoate synthase
MPWREQLKIEHEARAREKLWRTRSTMEGPQGRVVTVAGKDYLNFCSNDYLGLANCPQMVSAAVDSIQKYGTGSGASHLVCGHFDEHALLESEIAEFVGAEKAIVFSTGYMANLSIPQTFLGRNDLLLEDRLNHASLIDAGRVCEAKMKRYPHLDAETAASKLGDFAGRRKLVLTDGVFSMDGDQAPVAKLQEVCERHQALLVVDDAHGFGVLGRCGAGLLEQEGLRPTGNLLMIGTFGKAAGSFGAFVAGDEIYVESLIQFARTYIYTTALPPAVVAATRAAIRVIKNEPQRRSTLRRNVEYFRNRAATTGLELMNSQTPIQPLVLGTSEAALQASSLLKSDGIWVSAIRPPTVPIGSARLRITLSAEHTTEDIDRLVTRLGCESIAQQMRGRP